LTGTIKIIGEQRNVIQWESQTNYIIESMINNIWHIIAKKFIV